MGCVVTMVRVARIAAPPKALSDGATPGALSVRRHGHWLAFRRGRRVEQRPQLGFEHLQELHREAAGEREARRLRPRHIGGHCAVEAFAEEEYKSPGAVDDARAGDATAGAEMMVAIVAGTGLATDLQRGAV